MASTLSPLQPPPSLPAYQHDLPMYQAPPHKSNPLPSEALNELGPVTHCPPAGTLSTDDDVHDSGASGFTTPTHGAATGLGAEMPSPFSLRGYVAAVRETDIRKCWPFSLRLLDECIKEGKDPLLPPLFPPGFENFKHPDLTEFAHEVSHSVCLEGQHLQVQLDVSRTETQTDGEKSRQSAGEGLDVGVSLQMKDVAIYSTESTDCPPRTSSLKKSVSNSGQADVAARHEFDQGSSVRKAGHRSIEDIRQSVIEGCKCCRQAVNRESMQSTVKMSNSLAIVLHRWEKSGHCSEHGAEDTTDMWLAALKDRSVDRDSQKEVTRCKESFSGNKQEGMEHGGQSFSLKRVEGKGNGSERDSRKSRQCDIQAEIHCRFCLEHLHIQDHETEGNENQPLSCTHMELRSSAMDAECLESRFQRQRISLPYEGGSECGHVMTLEAGLLEAPCSDQRIELDTCEPSVETDSLLPSGDALTQQKCPVCLIFQSSSNTALNAHIDHCLAASDKERMKPKWQRAKVRKKRSIAELCLIAPPCVLDEFHDVDEDTMHADLKVCRTVQRGNKQFKQRQTSASLAFKTNQVSDRIKHRRKVCKRRERHAEALRFVKKSRMDARNHCEPTLRSSNQDTLTEGNLPCATRPAQSLPPERSCLDVGGSPSFSQQKTSSGSRPNCSTQRVARDTLLYDTEKDGSMQDAQPKDKTEDQNSKALDSIQATVLYDIGEKPVDPAGSTSKFSMSSQKQKRQISARGKQIANSMAPDQQLQQDSQQDMPSCRDGFWTPVQYSSKSGYGVNQKDNILNDDNEQGTELAQGSHYSSHSKSGRRSKEKYQHDGTISFGDSSTPQLEILEISSAPQKTAVHTEHKRDGKHAKDINYQEENPLEGNVIHQGGKQLADRLAEKPEEHPCVTSEVETRLAQVTSPNNGACEFEERVSTGPPLTPAIFSTFEDNSDRVERIRIESSSLAANSADCCLRSHHRTPFPSLDPSLQSASFHYVEPSFRGQWEIPPEQLGMKGTLDLQKSLSLTPHSSEVIINKRHAIQEVQNAMHGVGVHQEPEIRHPTGIYAQPWKAEVTRRQVKSHHKSLTKAGPGHLRPLIPVHKLNTFDMARMFPISALTSSFPIPRTNGIGNQKATNTDIVTAAGLKKQHTGLNSLKIFKYANELAETVHTASHKFSESDSGRHDRHSNLAISDPALHQLGQKTIHIHPAALPLHDQAASTGLPRPDTHISEQASQMSFEITAGSGAQTLQPAGFHSSLPAWMQVAIKDQTPVSLAPLEMLGPSIDESSLLRTVGASNRDIPTEQTVFNVLGKPVLRLMGKTMVLAPGVDQGGIDTSQASFSSNTSYLSFLQPAAHEKQELLQSNTSQLWQVYRQTDNGSAQYATSAPFQEHQTSGEPVFRNKQEHIFATSGSPLQPFPGSDVPLSSDIGKSGFSTQQMRHTPPGGVSSVNAFSLGHFGIMPQQSALNTASSISTVPLGSKYMGWQHEKSKGQLPFLSGTSTRSECGYPLSNATQCNSPGCTIHPLAMQHDHASDDQLHGFLSAPSNTFMNHSNLLNSKALPWMSNARNKERVGKVADIIIIDDEDDALASSERPFSNSTSLDASLLASNCRPPVLLGMHAPLHHNSTNTTFVTGHITGHITHANAFLPMVYRTGCKSGSSGYFPPNATGTRILDFVSEQEGSGQKKSRTLVNPRKRVNHTQPLRDGKTARTSETGLATTSSRKDHSSCDHVTQCWGEAGTSGSMHAIRTAVEQLQEKESMIAVNTSKAAISGNTSRMMMTHASGQIQAGSPSAAAAPCCSVPPNSMESWRLSPRTTKSPRTTVGLCSTNMNPAEMDCQDAGQFVTVPFSETAQLQTQDSAQLEGIHDDNFPSPCPQPTVTTKERMYSSLSRLHSTTTTTTNWDSRHLCSSTSKAESNPYDSGYFDQLPVSFVSAKKPFSWFPANHSGENLQNMNSSAPQTSVHHRNQKGFHGAQSIKPLKVGGKFVIANGKVSVIDLGKATSHVMMPEHPAVITNHHQLFPSANAEGMYGTSSLRDSRDDLIVTLQNACIMTDNRAANLDARSVRAKPSTIPGAAAQPSFRNSMMFESYGKISSSNCSIHASPVCHYDAQACGITHQHAGTVPSTRACGHCIINNRSTASPCSRAGDFVEGPAMAGMAAQSVPRAFAAARREDTDYFSATTGSETAVNYVKLASNPLAHDMSGSRPRSPNSNPQAPNS